MEVGGVVQEHIKIFGFDIVVNGQTLLMSLFVIISIIALVKYSVSEGVQKSTTKRRLFYVAIVGFVKGFKSLCDETLGERKSKIYMPFIATLFVYVLTSNLWGVLPGMPQSPTEDLSICLSLALICFIISHGSGIKKKGLKGYCASYCEPLPFMLPLNIIGEIGQTLSHCFRLFGNIFGGGIIFVLVPYVFYKVLGSFGLPDISTVHSFTELHGGGQWLEYGITLPFISIAFFGVYSFFGLFAGTVQALVFTMLALTYVAGQLEE